MRQRSWGAGLTEPGEKFRLTEPGEKFLRSPPTSVCRMCGHLRDLRTGRIDAGMVDPDVNIGVCRLIFMETCGVPFDPK